MQPTRRAGRLGARLIRRRQGDQAYVKAGQTPMLVLNRRHGRVRTATFSQGTARNASQAIAMRRQDKGMSGIKKERWTEAEVLGLPPGEHDYFDRKSGALLNNPDFRKDLGKALSALANSGGGHIVLGMNDRGIFDGLPAMRGNTPSREWLEQVIPSLLSYPLEDFRVHEVVQSSPSGIPAGRVAIVVDVGDSALAPHQAADMRTYYYREGGHSKPAPHFYLETLRNRLVNPSLTAELVAIQKAEAYEFEGGVFVESRLDFSIENVGRVAAYKWALVLERASGLSVDRRSDYRFHFVDFPKGNRGRSGSMSLDDTILPGLSRHEKRDFGIHLRASPKDHMALLGDLRTLLSPDLQVHYRVVTETSRGEPKSSYVAALIDHERLIESLFPLRAL